MIERRDEGEEVALLYEAMAATITAKRLQTPLSQALWLDAGEAPRVAAVKLAESDYDQAPVREDGELRGLALRSTLEHTRARTVRRCTVPLTTAVLVSAEAGLPSLLPVLALSHFACVLDGHTVSGFVTPSDLNKQLARTYFFLMIASLEVLLGSLIRSTYPDLEQALATLTPARADFARGRLLRDQKLNVALDLVAEMDLTDLLRVVAGTDRLRGLVGHASKTSFLAASRHLPDLRHSVMHPTRAFLGADRDVSALIAIESELRRFVDACMAEVDRSDPWVAASLTG